MNTVIKVNLCFGLIILCGIFGIITETALGDIEPVAFGFPFETYEQEVVIKFLDQSSAEAAAIEIEPLYNGHQHAVSCRWDDNIEQDLEVKKRLDERGIKATWYVNSNTIFYLKELDFQPIAKKLLENGHSLGGHGYSHPYIAYVNRNRAFQEAAQVRIEWESELDTLMHSYAFSFVNYRNPLEGPISQQDIIRTLERAGFYHLAVYKTFGDQQPSDMIISIIMPPENADFETFKNAVDWAMNSDELLDRFRCISHSMHGWYGTPAVEYGFDELEKRLDYMNSFENLWHCNQNQYAAYRHQYLNSDLEIVSREGNQLVCRLRRPVIAQLNDPIPLTISIQNVQNADIKSVTSEGNTLKVSSQGSDNRILLNVPHPESQMLPVKIGRMENPENRPKLLPSDTDEDFPGLGALLSFNGNALKLQLSNKSKSHIENVRITYRLPLAWKEGVYHKKQDRIRQGQRWIDTLTPTAERPELKYMGGSHYFVAQIDFVQDGEPGRLYATCNYELPFNDTFPRDGFVLMGPVQPDQFDLDAFGKLLQSRGGLPPAEWKLPDNSAVSWRNAEDNAPVPTDYFDPEVIRTQGDWYETYTPVYVLYSKVNSDTEQWAKVTADWGSVKAIYTNGVKLEGLGIKLRQGENHLVIVHSHENFTGSGEHAGCFLRLGHPEANERLKTIHYTKPALPLTNPFADNAATIDAKPFKIALLQMQAAGFDQQANLEKADAYCRQAAATGADIALMPEMFNIGYTAFQGIDTETIQQWQQRAVSKDSDWVLHFAKLANELDMAIGVTYLQKWDGPPRNTLTVFDRHGKEVLTYAKVHTCDFANFEAATTPGQDWYVADLDTKNGTVKLGAMICYDREFPESARILMLKGAEIVLTPNACLLDNVRLAQFGTRALENSMIMAMTNYPDPGYGGRSVVYMIDGKPLVEGTSQEGVFTATVEMGWIREARKRSIWGNSFRRPHRYEILTDLEKDPIFERQTGLGEPFVAEER
jgi:predicted amidohydrolase